MDFKITYTHAGTPMLVFVFSVTPAGIHLRFCHGGCEVAFFLEFDKGSPVVPWRGIKKEQETGSLHGSFPTSVAVFLCS